MALPGYMEHIHSSIRSFIHSFVVLLFVRSLFFRSFVPFLPRQRERERESARARAANFVFSLEFGRQSADVGQVDPLPIDRRPVGLI